MSLDGRADDIAQLRIRKGGVPGASGEAGEDLLPTRDIVYWLDTAGRIACISDSVIRYGYEPSSLLGTRMLDFVYPDDLGIARHHVAERRTGERRTRVLALRFTAPKAGLSAVDDKTGRSDRQPLFLLRAEGIYQGGIGTGHFIGTRGIVSEITDLVQAMEALKASGGIYQRIFMFAPSAISIASLEDGRFLDVNREFETISGYERDDLIGRSSLDIGIWADPAQRKEVVDLIKSGGHAANAIVGLRTKNGLIKKVRYDGQGIDIAGSPCLLSGFIDMTDRIQAEKTIKHDLEEKEALLRELYHRTKNNMQLIISLLNLQSSTSGDPTLLFAFTEMKNRIYSMALAHDKLYDTHDLSNIEPAAYIDDLASQLMSTYHISPAKVSVKIDADGIKIPIDLAIPYGLVLNELLSNAFKYAFLNDRAGSVAISLHLSGSGILEMEVSDDGVGVPSGFDVARDGLMGLQLVLELAKNQLGGSVEFDFSKGVRCTIRFSLDRSRPRIGEGNE
jgi:PAS domain S-box-containing protein